MFLEPVGKFIQQPRFAGPGLRYDADQVSLFFAPGILEDGLDPGQLLFTPDRACFDPLHTAGPDPERTRPDGFCHVHFNGLTLAFDLDGLQRGDIENPAYMAVSIVRDEDSTQRGGVFHPAGQVDGVPDGGIFARRSDPAEQDRARIDAHPHLDLLSGEPGILGDCALELSFPFLDLPLQFQPCPDGTLGIVLMGHRRPK